MSDDRHQSVVQGWSLDGRYQPSKHQTPTARFESLSPQSPHHVKVYLQAFTPLDFHDAPLIAVKTLLSFNVLSIPEDDVLTAVMRYVCNRLDIPTSLKSWTLQQRERALPHLRDLIPLIRYLSLSTDTFLHVLEPLELLSQSQLINKYRFDALTRFSSQKLTFDTICYYYRSVEERRQVIQSLRGISILVESAHPYSPEKPVRVQIDAWAPHMLIEFDRRSDMLPGTCLDLCTDSDGFNAFEGHSDEPWLHKSTIKTMVLDRNTVYVHGGNFPSMSLRWGWKMFVVPLVYESDFERPASGEHHDNEES